MYTVISDVHGLYPAATGLRLTEAWTLMMALAGCDYAFERDNAGAMRLFLWNNAEALAEGSEEPMNDGRDWSVYHSNFPDNALARVAIMRCFVDDQVRSVGIITDERHRAQQGARIGQERGQQEVHA